ncbi:hypothetical protein ACHQM5_027402 [Ranunculus cassubicifolius]
MVGEKRKHEENDDDEVEPTDDDEELSYEEEETDEDGTLYRSDRIFEVLKQAGVFQQKTGIMSKLPMEIFFDILSRVPVKSISQCRWVCNAWYFSIKHPLFIQMQHRRAMDSNSHFLIINETLEENYFLIEYEGLDTRFPQVTKLPELPRMEGFNMPMISCNGLLFFQESPYVVCNPITGECIIPPNSPKNDIDDILSCFGFDSNTGMYKIMRAVKINSDFAEAHVHTLGSAGWRTISDVPYTFGNMATNVFVNGAFHWLGTEPRKCKKSEVIVSFKLGTEEFCVKPLPPFLQKYDAWHGLFEVGGCLSAKRIKFDKPSEIWVMKTYGDLASWSKEYVFRDMEPWSGPYDPIKVMENGELLMKSDDKFIGYYNPEKSKWSKYDILCIEDYLPEKRCIWQALAHVGSLISLRDISQPTRSVESTILDASRFDKVKYFINRITNYPKLQCNSIYNATLLRKKIR